MVLKNKLSILILLLGIFAGAVFSAKETEAAKVRIFKTEAGIRNLKQNKEYKFDLDGNGKRESISYSLTEKGIYKVKVNGVTVKSLKLTLEDISDAYMQVLDIDKKDKKLDIWVYIYGDDESISYSALYEYSNKKLTRTWKGNLGFISSTNGRGRFTLVEYCAIDNAYLTGNHFDKVVFQLKKRKVSKVSDRTYYFYETYGSNNYFSYEVDGKVYPPKNIKDRGLITVGKMKFHTAHSKKSKTFTVKKGVKCYPLKMYIGTDSKVYVQYKIKKGKKGWLCAEDFQSYEKLPFSDMAFFG